MTFDHLGNKSGLISKKALNPSTTTKWLLDEIAKCDVVCFNCHSERTHQRALAEGQRREGSREITERLLPPGERTHCPHGHEYTPENTKYGKNGGRWCRACARAATSAWEKRHIRVGHGKGRSGKRVPKATAA